VLESAVQRALARAAREYQRAVDVEKDEFTCAQIDSPRTPAARGPFADGSSSKLTR
jgi:hypothetical protein